MSKVNHTYTH